MFILLKSIYQNKSAKNDFKKFFMNGDDFKWQEVQAF